MIATEHTRSRLFAWARGTAVATLVANMALYAGVVALAPSPAEAAAHPNVIWPGTGWAFLFIPLTGLLFLIAVVLAMEYRVRSRDSADPYRTKRLRLLALLLTPPLLHVLAFFPLMYYMLAN